ncbi:MAG: hypothetical protein FWH55_12070 [Oscillospiraceae bacterium]|nr:hypothetical protein [Oscillospiraceae bacterium]
MRSLRILRVAIIVAAFSMFIQAPVSAFAGSGFIESGAPFALSFVSSGFQSEVRGGEVEGRFVASSGEVASGVYRPSKPYWPFGSSGSNGQNGLYGPFGPNDVLNNHPASSGGSSSSADSSNIGSGGGAGAGSSAGAGAGSSAGAGVGAGSAGNADAQPHRTTPLELIEAAVLAEAAVSATTTETETGATGSATATPAAAWNAQTNAQTNANVNAQTNVQANTQANAQANTPAGVQANAQANTQASAQTNVQTNTQANAQGNAQTNTQANVQGGAPGNTQGSSEGNAKAVADESSALKLVEITKPISDEVVYKDTYAICGVRSEDIDPAEVLMVYLAKRKPDTLSYEEAFDIDKEGSWIIGANGIFARTVSLTVGDNNFALAIYRQADSEKLSEANVQIVLFNIIYPGYEAADRINEKLKENTVSTIIRGIGSEE